MRYWIGSALERTCAARYPAALGVLMSPRIILSLPLAMGLGGVELSNCDLAHAQSGCCSHHNGVCGCTRGRAICCDGNTSPTCGCSGAGDGAGDSGGPIPLLSKPAGRGAAPGVGPSEGSSQDLLSIEADLDGLCRGWSGDDPHTDEVCAIRNKLDKLLLKMGYCYGKKGQPGYEMRWHRCTKESNR